MSGPKDTLPPPPAPATEPALPDDEPPPLVIPRGHAQLAMSAALDALVRAYEHVERVGMACARALDQVQR